jgi:Fe-S-cluster-containing hydrogenase component 2
MKTTIYYFSATGNSLSMAHSIAAELGETELISIPKVMKESQIAATAARIGLVFPVYAWGPPRIVTDFAEKLKANNGQYIFAVATCGGTPGGTLIQLQKLLQQNDADLNVGFVVREASYALLKDNIVIRFVRSIAGKLPQSGKERLPEIVATIKNNQQHTLETSSWAANFVGSSFHEPALKSFKTSDQHFWVDDKCNLCRTCERVCPRENITIENDKHVWSHNCELCFACLQWCPQEAIQYQQETVTKERSHHPEVKIKDMLLR